jgi:hypothetical protein
VGCDISTENSVDLVLNRLQISCSRYGREPQCKRGIQLRQTREHESPKTAQFPALVFPRTALVLYNSGESEQAYSRSVRVDFNLKESFLPWRG